MQDVPINPEAAEKEGEDQEEQEAGESAIPLPNLQNISVPNVSQLWGFATSLAKEVQKTAAEVASSVQTVDWRRELSELSTELKADAELVKDQVEQLPERSEAALQPENLQAQRDRLVQGVNATFNLVDSLSRSLLTNASEMIATVKDAVQHEVQELSRRQRDEQQQAQQAALAYATAVTGGKYNHLDSQIAAMQRDSGTYCDEPEDEADFEGWLEGFSLEGSKEEIDKIVSENAFMAELQQRIVPLIVSYETFWTRYFYRLHKLREQHEQRQQLASRAALGQAEEEIGWGSEEEEEGGGEGKEGEGWGDEEVDLSAIAKDEEEKEEEQKGGEEEEEKEGATTGEEAPEVPAVEAASEAAAPEEPAGGESPAPSPSTESPAPQAPAAPVEPAEERVVAPPASTSRPVRVSQEEEEDTWGEEEDEGTTSKPSSSPPTVREASDQSLAKKGWVETTKRTHEVQDEGAGSATAAAGVGADDSLDGWADDVEPTPSSKKQDEDSDLDENWGEDE